MSYTNRLIEDYTTELAPQWAKLFIEPWRFNFLAQKWTCPKNDENRQKLPIEDWQKEKEFFIQQGKNINVLDTAEICSIYYNEQYNNTSYLVWLNFIDTNNNRHSIDVWINENGKNTKNIERCIDPRSPHCAKIIKSIKEDGFLSIEDAKLLQTIGSKTWEGTFESKVQKKLNSFIQEGTFEEVLIELKVPYIKLDKFGDHLYRGNPGRQSDYDICINDIWVRVDLKLLGDSDIKQQNPHDAELIISSNWRDGHTEYFRVKNNPNIENTDQFKLLLATFSAKQKEKGNCFIHIDKINLETGKVDNVLFGNNY